MKIIKTRPLLILVYNLTFVTFQICLALDTLYYLKHKIILKQGLLDGKLELKSS